MRYALLTVTVIGFVSGTHVLQPNADDSMSTTSSAGAGSPPSKTAHKVRVGNTEISKRDLYVYAGVGVAAFAFVLAIACCIWRGRNVGTINSFEGTVLSMSGLPIVCNPYVVVSCMGELVYRTQVVFRPGEFVTYDEPFSWSVATRDLHRFRTNGKIKFEVFNMVGRKYSVKDGSLGAAEIGVPELYTPGQTPIMESIQLRTRKGVTIHIKLKLFGEHAIAHNLRRFGQAWTQRKKEISFWGRLVAQPMFLFLIIFGIEHLNKGLAVSITDIVIGGNLALLVLPHFFHWIGITILDCIRTNSIGAVYSLCFSAGSTGFGVWKWLPLDDFDANVAHLILMGCLFFVGLVFLVADMRGEPGSSTVGRFLGGILSCCFTCCCPRL